MIPPARERFSVRLVRGGIRLLLRLLTHLDVAGAEYMPTHGPAIITPNHVVWSDVAFVFAVCRAPLRTLSAEKWENDPVLGRILRYFGNAIFVRRGEIDRKALQQALASLKSGWVMAIAPEGTRSYDGVLREGRNGAAWLASRSDAVITPIVVWGHENLEHDLLRLRRPHVYVRVGKPFRLPPEAARARSHDMSLYTDLIMRQMAILLPPDHRGQYGNERTSNTDVSVSARPAPASAAADTERQ